jgi:hypothetical protein
VAATAATIVIVGVLEAVHLLAVTFVTVVVVVITEDVAAVVVVIFVAAAAAAAAAEVVTPTYNNRPIYCSRAWNRKAVRYCRRNTCRSIGFCLEGS